MAATPEDLQNRIAHFQQMTKRKMHSQMRSIEVQFRHMAQGGDGTAASEGEIRKAYYPTWSTKDFQTVCDVFGWDYRGARLYDPFAD